MTTHVPAVSPHPAHAIPGTGVLILALAVLALIGAIVVLPNVTPAPDEGTTSERAWLTDQRRGEIDAGHSGPYGDVLLFRQGEINAANQ